MLKSLKGFVSFTATGRTLSYDIDFDQGTHAITGRNGSGKSMVLELIRFALFGSAALRGSIKDFSSYDIELVFDVKGVEHTVHRTPGKASLDDTVVGVTPVDNRIMQLFGYGLNVFDIANHCMQGDLEALTRMKGTERRKIVDKTIGFDMIDKLTEWVAIHASECRGVVKAIHPAKPDEPAKPEGYQPSAVLSSAIAQLQPLQTELSEINGWLSSVRQEPKAPVAVPPCAKSEVDEFDRIVAEQREIKSKLVGVPVPTFTAEQLDVMTTEWMAYEAHLSFVREHGERPDLDVQQIVGLQLVVSNYQLWCNKRDLRSQLERHRSKDIECPDCHSHFPLDGAHRARLLAELEQYARVEEVPRPSTTLDQDDLARMLKRAVAWATHTPASKPALTLHEISMQKQGILLAPLRDLIRALPTDPSPRWRAWTDYQNKLAWFEAERVVYRKYVGERGEKEKRKAELAHVPGTISVLQANRRSAEEYEARLSSYQHLLAKWQEDVERLIEAEGELDQYEAAAKGLKLLRSRIKQHLVPSLNAAASMIISQMTGGELSSIQIDETFEEMNVNGIDISKLEGSGKVVANLAIRLGLGQVLTNKVFPVFMGDEIDASMDNVRAEYTTECLAKLPIKQLLIVSHKVNAMSADRHINLAQATYDNGAPHAGTAQRLG